MTDMSPQNRDLMTRQLDNLEKSTKLEHSRHRWGIVFKSLGALYLALVTIGVGTAYWDKMPPSSGHIAVVRLNGPIAEDQPASAGKINAGLRAAFEENEAKAVVIAINSPGGSPVQSSYIYNEIMRLKTLHEKPVYAVISDIGASGAYYVASAADEIFANESSLVGSIGVTAAGFGFTGLIEKIGVERRQFTSGEHKTFLDPFAPVKEDEAEFWNGVLGDVHQNFINAVERGRGDKLKNTPDLYSGLIWNGSQAIELGLIDGLGSVRSISREKHDIEEFWDYTHEEPFAKLKDILGASLGQGLTHVISPDREGARLSMQYH
ncbi:MAG: signal peptide peptidase SppA [Halioglobus sp.]